MGLTIYDIKYRLNGDEHFFTRSTMKFFHQTLKDFRVKKISEQERLIYAPMRDSFGHFVGNTARIFNLETNTLRSLTELERFHFGL